MKNIDATFKAFLANECLTLASCLRIVRSDGRAIYLTDHDADIIIDSNVYKSDPGFTRTAVKGSAGYETDAAEIESFFKVGFIEEKDIRRGLFDVATAKLFIVNFKDVSMGVMILKSGTLGEIDFSADGSFKVEILGPLNRFVKIGEKFSPECRANLGDNRCKFPINPLVRRDYDDYAVGDFIKVETENISLAQNMTVPVVEPSFETGPIGSAWVDGPGSSWINNIAEVDYDNSGGNHAGHAGQFTASDPKEVYLSQIVDMTGVAGWSNAAADAGLLLFSGGCHARNLVLTTIGLDPDTDARGRLTIEALKANNESLGFLFDSGEKKFTTSGWEFAGVNNKRMFSGVRKIRYTLYSIISDTSGAFDYGVAFDNVHGKVKDLTGASNIESIFANRIYECTTAGRAATTQPTYDTTVGNSTTDGTAVFKAYEGWTRHAVVASVSDNQTFTITVTESRAVDDWFNGGIVKFLSGNNTDFVIEVKDWINSSSTIVLFLPTARDVQVGDWLAISPGCDKRIATCVNKFAISGSSNFASGNAFNFRGEPHLPGRDAVMKTLSPED